jgi:hypothetical protein
MREPIEKMLERLGIDRVMYPYEAQPWFYYDDEKGVTCSAEVRMGPDGEDIEAEVQIVDDNIDEFEEPPPPPPPSYTEEEKKDDEDEEGKEEGNGGKFYGGPQQVLFLRAEPVGNDEWAPKHLRIKGKDFVNAFHDWEGKGCDFFISCVQSINMEEVPDVDALIEQHMKDTSRTGRGRRGRVGRKSPKMNHNTKMKP